MDQSVRAELSARLLEWYAMAKRDLPWRRRQEDPYAVWISEIMLQQTQVQTVVPYFERWTSLFPNIMTLAEAPLEDVLTAWAGLGYYARARNLHRAAREIVNQHDGEIPSIPSKLLALPGIGRYSAGAILSIAFNQREPIVDANVARVLSRLTMTNGDLKSSANQSKLWRIAEELIPEGDARDFNQGLMELGALVCTPTDPACDRCPILRYCGGGNSEDPTAWPQNPPGKRTLRSIHASAVILRDGEVLLSRRPPHGLWGGLWEIPRRECETGESAEACAVRAAFEVVGISGTAANRIAVVKHSVTHHAITLHGIRVTADTMEPQAKDCQEARWVRFADSVAMPLSAPQRMLMNHLMAPDPQVGRN